LILLLFFINNLIVTTMGEFKVLNHVCLCW